MGVLMPESKYRQANKAMEFLPICESKLNDMVASCQPIVQDPIFQVVLPFVFGIMLGASGIFILKGI